MKNEKEVGNWSNQRWVGNTYFPSNAIALPGSTIVDSEGNKVSPVDIIPNNSIDKVSNKGTRQLKKQSRRHR
jgi:hypothetical protein